jgi:hypothetical protein
MRTLEDMSRESAILATFGKPRRRRRRASQLFIAPLLLSACGGFARTPALSPAWPFAVDTLLTEATQPGVTHRYIYTHAGPWAIHVLDVDLDHCNSAVAVKGADGAIGREKTSTLLGNLGRTRHVVGGVNADFFSLTTPPGVPTGALISRGRVIAGPSGQPVLAFDSTGVPRITTLHATGTATAGAYRYEISGWNHAIPDGLAFFDANWGHMTDTASSVVEVVLSGGIGSRVVLVDTATSGVTIPAAGGVLIAGRNVPAEVRDALLALRPGDALGADVSLAPVHPREAVGGRPRLVRDSLVPEVVDTEGQPGFATGRHPRTAAGLARGGKRLILVVVDGRQMPYSDGMTLRELANFMLVLGARDAINLDGGGSTTLVYADSASVLRIANRPSDAAGERLVGDALGIVSTCKKG